MPPETRHGEMAGVARQLRALAVIAAVVTATVGGCKVGPDYRPPEARMPSSFSSDATTQPATAPATSRPAEAPPVELSRWWRSLNDPALDSLIDRAIAANLDLAIAATRLEESRWERAATEADLWPTVSVGSGGPGRPPLYDRASGTRNYRHYETTPRASASVRQTVGASGLIGPPSLYMTAPGRRALGLLLTPGGRQRRDRGGAADSVRPERQDAHRGSR